MLTGPPEGGTFGALAGGGTLEGAPDGGTLPGAPVGGIELGSVGFDMPGFVPGACWAAVFFVL